MTSLYGDPPPYPEYTDPTDKFRKGEPCEAWKPVVDAAMRIDGVMVCSSCRRPMVVRLSEWVHGA